jgi:PGF-pre-PGF domain-containing protein
LWDGSAFNSQGYLTADTIDLNTTADSATIWTNHFSRYLFTTPAPTPSPTTAAPTTGGAASSSGGGTSDIDVGVAKKLKAGDTVGFAVSGSSIYEVTATVNTDVPKMMITVEKRSLTRGINEAPVDVYEYDEVNMYWTDDSEISRATLEFRVDKNWLSKSDYAFDDVVLLKYNEDTGNWEQLPTEFIGEENGYYLYRATTPAFSWFAIGLKEGATIVAEDKSTKIIKVVAEDESPDNLEALKNGEDTEETTTPTPTSTPLGPVSFIALLISGFIMFYKKR